MYKTITIHTPAVAQQSNVVEVSTLSTIPKFLQNAITLENHRLRLDNVEGPKSALLGSVIGYEKSDRTVSGYNCWLIGRVGIDLVKIEGIFYTKPPTVHAMLIPAKDEAKPVWVNSCNLIYNDDGTATLKTDEGNATGRIGIDFILCHGMKGNGKPKASILTRSDKSFSDYLICGDDVQDLGKLCEVYPA